MNRCPSPSGLWRLAYAERINYVSDGVSLGFAAVLALVQRDETPADVRLEAIDDRPQTHIQPTPSSRPIVPKPWEGRRAVSSERGLS